jgi:hypothetical protein
MNDDGRSAPRVHVAVVGLGFGAEVEIPTFAA